MDLFGKVMSLLFKIKSQALSLLCILGMYGGAAAAAKPLQSFPTLCNPIDGSPPGPAVPGILQARVLEWVATGVGCHFLLQCMKVKSENEVAQSCLTLRDPMDGSLPGSSVHGIFQTRAPQRKSCSN